MDVKVDLVDYGYVDCSIEYHMENNGIGEYEFWGSTGYDKGTDYPEITKIEARNSSKEIEDYIESNWDDLCEQITSRNDFSE